MGKPKATNLTDSTFRAAVPTGRPAGHTRIVLPEQVSLRPGPPMAFRLDTASLPASSRALISL